MFGFGGQLVVLNMIREALVTKRKWLSVDRFEEGASLSQLLPGPTMFQMSTFVGEELHSLLGALVCAFSLIAPAFICVLIIGSIYRASGNLPIAQGMLEVIGPAAIALIVAAGLQLSRRNLTNVIDMMGLVAGFVGVAFLHWQPALLLVGIGLVGMLARRRMTAVFVPLFFITTSIGSFASFSALFFSTGALAFGGGQVVIPLLQHDVVEKFHWLSAQQFLDGVALGQLTPGPIMITATFIGLLAFGIPGAIVATLGVFVPGFLYMLIARRTLHRWQENPWVRDFLRVVFSAAIGCVFGAAVLLAELEMHAWWQLVVLAVALAAALLKQSAPRIFAVAGAAGAVRYFTHV